MIILVINGFNKPSKIKFINFKKKIINFDNDILYSIISDSNEKIHNLITQMNMCGLNTIFIDKSSFSEYEISDLCKYYNIDIDFYNEPLLFYDYDNFIGGLADIYKLIIKNS